ncbi:hypothetical protein [Kaarinaea lacus]
MKSYLPWSLAVLLFVASGSTLMAEEKAEGDSSKMNIEMVVENCEKQYNEENYPDPDERNKLIDQCIDENSASQPAASE